MRIGVPKEIKEMENRVSDLVRHGHTVQVETGAGEGSGFADEEYRNAGAEIVGTAAEAWSSEMVIKVKEPLEPEYAYFRKDLLLYTYLHLAAEGSLTKALVDSKVTAIAYETVQLADGSLPLLTPMSEVSGVAFGWKGCLARRGPRCTPRQGGDPGWGCGRDERRHDGRGVRRKGGDPRPVSTASSAS